MRVDVFTDEQIAQLKPTHRDVLRAKGSYKAKALSLGIPVGTVRSRLNRARAALSKVKGEQGE